MGGITARTGRLRSSIINNFLSNSLRPGEVRSLRADYYFRIIIDNVFFREAVCEDSLLFIRQFKKTKYMKKLIIYLLMTVWMGVSIVLLCNEDESAALLPFALIKAGALASFLASTKVLCILTNKKLI